MRNWIPLVFRWKLFFSLSVVFLVAPAAGTFMHESAHWATAKYFHFTSPRLGFAYTGYCGFNAGFIRYWQLHRKYEQQIRNGAGFPEKAEFEMLKTKTYFQWCWIQVNGILSGLLIGTTGLLWLMHFKRKHTLNPDKIIWLPVILSLFWLRQPICLLAALGMYFLQHFHVWSCEMNLAGFWYLPRWSILGATGIAGAVIAAYVICYLVPARYRLTLLAAGALGGLAGTYLWFFRIGPMLLP